MTTFHSGAALGSVEEVRSSASSPGLLTRIARSAVLRRLAEVREGSIVLREDFPLGARHVFGSPATDLEEPVHLAVHDPRFYPMLARRGTLGVAESYMDGWWSADDPARLVRVFLRNRRALGGINSGLARIARFVQSVANLRFTNTRTGSRRNIHAHYDLGNDFFRLFLDPTMSYSSAVFEDDAATLEQAQIAKLDRLAKKLRLTPSDHLLEIGTGWGGLAVHAAARYGCRVTTTTISDEQHRQATELVAEAGLQDRVTVLLKDYRDLRGTYDKLVSVEMIEAVGSTHLDGYLKVCSERLAADGIFALQAITIHDPDYEKATRSVDFIKRYVFPGSFIPSTTAILQAATRSTDLRLRHVEDLASHYRRTLSAWRDNFLANEDAIEALGHDARFRRLWDWYLCYCEGGFAERYLGVQQMVFTKPRHRAPEIVGVLD